jgi:hypothetical protein
MNAMTWIRLVLLVAFAALFNACQAPGAPGDTPAGPPASDQGFASPQPAPPPSQAESPLAFTQVESPLAGAAGSPDCVGVAGIDGYQMVRRIEIQLTQPDGSIQPYIVENLLLVTRTDGQNCNSHMVIGAMVDPQTGEKTGAIDESYAVDDLVFAYCSMCSPPDNGVWRVSKRTAGNDPSVTSGPLGPFAVDVPVGLTPTGIGPIALERLVAQSSVVGDEAINGFATVHRRFTDRQALAEAVGWPVGAAPNDPLEVTTAQVDMWLTLDARRLVRLVFQAEGKTQAVSGSGVLHPFALKDEFNFTAVDRNTPVVVPDKVLAAVESQRKALEGE